MSNSSAVTAGGAGVGGGGGGGAQPVFTSSQQQQQQQEAVAAHQQNLQLYMARSAAAAAAVAAAGGVRTAQGQGQQVQGQQGMPHQQHIGVVNQISAGSLAVSDSELYLVLYLLHYSARSLIMGVSNPISCPW